MLDFCEELYIISVLTGYGKCHYIALGTGEGVRIWDWTGGKVKGAQTVRQFRKRKGAQPVGQLGIGANQEENTPNHQVAQSQSSRRKIHWD